MSTNQALQITHTSTVTPDQIDELGHMNVRWYGHNALAATRAMCRGFKRGEPAVVSAYTRHHNEQLEGSELEVRSGVLNSPSRLRIFHELRNRTDGALAATFVHEVDQPPVETPPIDLPAYGQPRSLRLDSDAIATAPTLDEVTRRDLAVRLARDVTTEDSMGGDVVPSWLANNLIWSGERPEGEEEWIRIGPDGERIAFATMESRMWIGRLAPVGTRIQSFGAVVDIGDKTSHSISWAFDLATGEPLAVFEVLNLCFNLETRRSMSMPEAIRSREVRRHHADLGPTVEAS